MGKIRTNHGIEHWEWKDISRKMKQPKRYGARKNAATLLKNKVGKTETNLEDLIILNVARRRKEE